MIVEEVSPLDFFIKELDNQPFPYYFTRTIFRISECVPAESR